MCWCGCAGVCAGVCALLQTCAASCLVHWRAEGERRVSLHHKHMNRALCAYLLRYRDLKLITVV